MRAGRSRKPLRKPNQRLKILYTAFKLNREFSIQELAVESWKLFRDDFGMRTYSLPDVVTVYSKVQSESGLIRSGLLEYAEKNLRISAKGVRIVKRLVVPYMEAADGQRDDGATQGVGKRVCDEQVIDEKIASEQVAGEHDRLEDAQPVDQIDSDVTRRDDDMRMESADHARKHDVASISAASGTRNAVVIVCQRIENGRPIETHARKPDGEKADTGDSQSGEQEVAVEACHYCGAGTAPRFVDLQKRPMCGGCHRDLGFGKKATGRRLKKAEREDMVPETPASDSAMSESATPERVVTDTVAVIQVARAAPVERKSLAGDGMILLMKQENITTVATSDEPVKKRRKYPRRESLPVIDFSVNVPHEYIDRKFQKARLSGHSQQCIMANAMGCIVECPVRVAWEVDGKPKG